MVTIETPIIPSQPTFAKTKGTHLWNKEAICVFVATGFFLNKDTFWTNEIALPPASKMELDTNGLLAKSQPYFQWHYSPRNISFDQALKEFTSLFENIIDNQVGDKKVILPLSGGLDSRTQAAALHYLGKEVNAYSYEFKNGYAETRIAKKIAKTCGFSFKAFTIQEGYLWDCIEQLARINNCYSEFTHPRQMAIIDKFESMGDVFSLGHWGDVLFDRGLAEGMNEKDALALIKKKVVKKGGMELAQALWNSWSLSGNFNDYFDARIKNLWEGIPIKNMSAKMRAFKSMYWAPRWTSTNLSIFQEKRPITLPYYSNEMCQFICTLPEEYLADRKLQIAYIKKRNPKLANITWEAKKPFNLYHYQYHKTPFHLPYRVLNKIIREGNRLFGKPFIQRNWELQFLGKENAEKLEKYIFSDELASFIPTSIIHDFYQKFQNEDAVYYSHSVSMLLTLALKMMQDE